MKVDVEVKTTPRSSGSEGGSGSGAALQRSGKAELPPAPRDGFRHQSLAQEPTDYSPYVKLGSKYQINLFGLWFAFWAGIVWGAVWAVILLFQKPLIEYLDKIDPMRRNVDWVAATWGRLSCLCTGLTPEITGVDNIPDGPAVRFGLVGRCLVAHGHDTPLTAPTHPPTPTQPRAKQVYVANHVSWMDVPYSALLPVHCKYLAKSDLTKVPVLGDAMALSKHVLLDREDKRSQMEALTGALKILKKGTPIFVFPEGTRGPEGRLQPFKMGAFKVAAKAGVPIVPVSIAGTHLIMPREAIMPQRPSRGIAALHVHPPIPTAGRTEKELADLSFDIINEALSDEQRSLHPTEKDSDASPM